MLTMVLLAVLALGVGLVAVFAAEQGNHATESRKLRRRGAHEADALDRNDRATSTDRHQRDTPAVRSPVERSTPGATSPEGLVSAVVGSDIPASAVATEGAFKDVAIASVSRRIRSLVVMVVIVVLVGTGTAAAVGAGSLIIGGLLDSAIG